MFCALIPSFLPSFLSFLPLFFLSLLPFFLGSSHDPPFLPFSVPFFFFPLLFSSSLLLFRPSFLPWFLPLFLPTSLPPPSHSSFLPRSSYLASFFSPFVRLFLAPLILSFIPRLDGWFLPSFLSFDSFSVCKELAWEQDGSVDW